MLVDAHCHLNSLSDDAKAEVIDSFGLSGNKLIDSSIDLESSKKSLRLSEQYPFVFSSLGFHPFSCHTFSDYLYKTYKSFFKKNNKIVAIGEVGLDCKAAIPFLQQEEILKKWLRLAVELDLPVLIHNRMDKKSSDKSCDLTQPRIISLLDDYFSDYSKVVFHCFSYSADFLKQIIDKGGYASFSLNVLRKNKDIIEALKSCPEDNLLLETDSPYMKIKNRPSSPLDIQLLYSYMACLRDVSEEDLKESVLSNLKRVFKNIV